MRTGIVLGLLLALFVMPASAQRRSGLWFGVEGWAMLNCSECENERSAPGAGFALGGTVSRSLLVGIGLSAWYGAVDTETGLGTASGSQTVATLTPLARFYPREGRLALDFGVGLGLHVHTSGKGSTGPAAILGATYELPIDQRASLAPFVRGVATNTHESKPRYVQLGMGLTFH